MHSKDARKLLPPVTEAQKLIDNLYDEAADVLSDLGDPEWGKVVLEGIQDVKKQVINSILSEPEFPDMTPVAVTESLEELPSGEFRDHAEEAANAELLHEDGLEDIPIGTLFEVTDELSVLRGAVVLLIDHVDATSFLGKLAKLPETEIFRRNSTTYYLGKPLRLSFHLCRQIKGIETP